MIERAIEVFGLSPELALGFMSFGELANRLGGLLLDTVSFILPVGASLSVTAVIPYYTAMSGRERSPSVSPSPDSEY